MNVVIIAAVARNGVIGKDGKIPWHYPSDLKRFKHETMGQIVVMGRHTYETVGLPLPGRITIVLSSHPIPGVFQASSLDEALDLARLIDPDGVCWIAGGAEVYREAMDVADELDITEIPLEPDGDAFFPEIDPKVWIDSYRDHHHELSIKHYFRRQTPLS